ncbi:MAG: PD40 domain-containing protein [Candidatus Xiphinematobacter sp.]|nr:MAG: PD40 domain-containing protein [Candidatus Xiphinematobacter sp.]
MKNLGGLFLYCLVISAATAEAVPTITIYKSDRIPLALSQIIGADGNAMTHILQNDLDLSGWFSSSGREKALYTVSGRMSGGSLVGRLTDISGKCIFSRNYRNHFRMMAHLFVDDIVQALTGKMGIASKRVAFVSTRTGRKEIYLCDYDGSTVEQVTRDRNISVRPTLNPGGSRLAYTGYLSGYADIYLVNLLSGSRHRLVRFPGTNSGAAFSPDGSYIACTASRDGRPEIYVVDMLAEKVSRITRTRRGVASSPTWSADGHEIIYVGDEMGGPQLYRVSINGRSRMAEHVRTGFGYCTEPNWSPDGRKIAFNVWSYGSLAIAVKDLIAGNTRLLARGENPTWGADSRHLIFTDGNSLILLDSQTGCTTHVLCGYEKISEPYWGR